jgi:hypothetical protein
VQHKYTHYISYKKNAHHGEAIVEGFQARRVPVENARIEGDGIHIVGGLQFGSLDLMIELRANPKPYLFMDRAYFGGGPGTNMLRIVPNAYQHNKMPEVERWARNKQPIISEWQYSHPLHGKFVMVVPPSAAICLLFDLGDWLKDTIHQLAQITDRPVYVSYKGDGQPLQDRLKKCHVVVTWTSNVAVEAICAGVPAIVSRHSAAAPVAGDIQLMDQHSIEYPKYPDTKTRQTWANGLTWGQFSLEEIRSGVARKIIESSYKVEA